MEDVDLEPQVLVAFISVSNHNDATTKTLKQINT